MKSVFIKIKKELNKLDGIDDFPEVIEMMVDQLSRNIKELREIEEHQTEKQHEEDCRCSEIDDSQELLNILINTVKEIEKSYY